MSNTSASTSRVQVALIQEVDFGVTPTAGNGKKLRVTSESLNFDISKDSSKELRDDRQTSSMQPVGAQASGSLSIELQYAEHDDLIAAALQGAWATYGTKGVGTTFTADFTATTITASAAPIGASAFTTLKKGQWFRLNAPANANHGKRFRVSPVTAPTATIITLDPSTPATVGAAVANCAVQTSRLVNGVDQPSFSIEKVFADIGQFLLYRGMTVSKFSAQFQSEALTTGSFDFMGKDSTVAQATALPGVTAESQTFEIHNAATGIGNIWENGAPLESFIKTLQLNVDNALRARTAIGTLGAVSVGSGTIKVDGTFEAYFEDADLYQKFLSNQATALSWASVDADGNGYVFTLPKVNISKAEVTAGGLDQDVMAKISFTALADVGNADAALRKTIIIDRVGAAV